VKPAKFRKTQKRKNTAATIGAQVDNLQLTTMLCLDISAAFDTISHGTLLQRLHEDCGVSAGSGKPLNWLRSSH